jgi:DNA-binding transcriptional LysR family regulator
LDNEPFVVHHLCSDTELKMRRLFEAYGTRWNIAAELWSFENVKDFVQKDVGVAVVPRIVVTEELAEGRLSQIPVRELSIPRQTLMIYRGHGYMSDTARQFVELVKHSNVNAMRTPSQAQDRPQPDGECIGADLQRSIGVAVDLRASQRE